MRRRSVQDEPLLSIDDIMIRVWERLVFAGTSWCIGSDQRWAVVGPTGSGKSTLVKALWGGVPVVRGDIRYGFAPDGDARLPEDRIVHVSFDDRRELVGGADAYYQARWDSVGDQDAPTVADVLAEAADEAMPDRSAGTGRARHCRRAADRLGMAGLLDRKITHLSNGEQSKLLIARALARCPVLLILDDPFAGLDNRTRSRLRGALGTLMTQGELIVLVTSRVDDLPEAVALYREWMTSRSVAHPDVFYVAQAEASFRSTYRALREAEALDLVARVLRACDGGRMLGFTVACPLPDRRSFHVLFEISDLTARGAAQFMYRELCREIDAFDRVNAGGASGLPSLERVKESYRPRLRLPCHTLAPASGA